MNRYIEHAKTEFEAAGWTKNGRFKDKMQQKICAHVLRLLKEFHEEGHSGSTALYARALFVTLSNFKNIAPITSRKQEWMKVERASKKNRPWRRAGTWQNRRNSEAFSYDGGKTYYLLSEGRRNGKPKKFHQAQPRPRRTRTSEVAT